MSRRPKVVLSDAEKAGLAVLAPLYSDKRVTQQDLGCLWSPGYHSFIDGVCHRCGRVKTPQ